MTDRTVHANCLIVGTCGLLIRGDAGSGKSFLTEFLINAARAKGNQGVLVADDRVFLKNDRGQVIASVPETIAGKLEVRGFDLVETRFEGRARIHLLVDLVPLVTMERLPEDAVMAKEIAGHKLPVVTCPESEPEISLRLIRWALRYLFPDSPDYI